MIKNAFMGSERMIKIAVVEDNKKDQAILTKYLKKFSARFEIETFDSAVLFLTDYKPKCLPRQNSAKWTTAHV